MTANSANVLAGDMTLAELAAACDSFSACHCANYVPVGSNAGGKRTVEWPMRLKPKSEQDGFNKKLREAYPQMIVYMTKDNHDY